METKKNNTPEPASIKPYHVQIRLTYEFKKKLKKRMKLLWVNKEFTEFIAGTIKKLPQKDKLEALYYFKKLAMQVLRAPDTDHYAAFKDEYDEHFSEIQEEQEFYAPVKWIDAEIEYINNSSERLTADDVKQKLDIMQEAKHRLSKPWLTSDEVMELFRISKSTLNRRIAEGMPAHKKGKALTFYLEELNEWMRKDAA